MKLSFEQVFYGRGEHGYAILGASSGAKPFTSRVESLCCAVGTPVGDYHGEAFLLSIPEGNHVLMVCGRNGSPDSMGRVTLFFHALIGLRKDLDTAGANAFTLFGQGAFAERMPSGGIDALVLDARPSEMRKHPLGDGIRFPAAIRSTGVPAPNEVREFIGGKANELVWATYAFLPMEGFDLQVLPLRSSVPAHLNEYVGNMHMQSIRLVRGAIVDQTPNLGGYSAGSSSTSSLSHIDRPSSDSPLPGKSHSMLLKLSLTANLFLIAACLMLLTPSKPAQTQLGPIVHDSFHVVTNTIVVTNFLSHAMASSVSALDEDREKILSNAKRDFLSELSIPETPTMDKLETALPSLTNSDNTAIREQLVSIIDFINNLQTLKEKQ